MKSKFYLSALLFSGALISNLGSLQANETTTGAEHSKPASLENVLENQNTRFLKEALLKGLMNMEATCADFGNYYSKDYVQHVDGKTLNYRDFLAHMDDLHRTLKSLKLEYLDIVAEGDKVATRHLARGVKKDGREIEVLVVAIFGFKEGKIISCDELTHMVKGAKEDRDIGSRH